jgi:hypothetical protein
METDMRKLYFAVPLIAGIALTGCSKKQVAVAAPPPQGAVAGSVAADRDGDGVIDGYYSADGIYHPNYVPPAQVQPAVYRASRRGERG